MGGTAAIDGVVEAFADRLRQRYRIANLILFGSRVTGKVDDWSDYDFVVVSPDFRGVPFLQRRRGMVALREPGISYDFLCYTPEEYQAKVQQLGIVREAVETGVRLV